MRTRTRRFGGLLLAAAWIAASVLVAPMTADAQFAVRPGLRVAPRIDAIGPRLEPRFHTGPDDTATLAGSGNSGTAVKDYGRGTKRPKSKSANSTGGSGNRTGVPPAGETRFVPDEVVIEVASSLSPQAIEALAQRNRLVRLESQTSELTQSTFFRWRVPDRRSVAAVSRTLGREANVRSAQPNYQFALQEDAPNDPEPVAPSEGDPAQYVLGKLNLPRAHVLAKGDDILIAVIDSGIDADHPELGGIVTAQFDALSAPEKPHTHGTAIAGAIAAHARLMGAAPDARILAIRAFGASGKSAEGTTFNILKGLDWAMAHGARVINMSFAGPVDPVIGRALAAAHKRGAVLVAAAGNAGPKSPPLYPAADANVIAVSATGPDDKLFAMSNRGRYIAVAAPGVDLLLPSVDAGYQVTSGTSFSAAYVSGIAALLLQKQPDLSPDAVRHALIVTARDIGPKGRDDQFGAGLVDAYRAIRTTQPALAGTVRPEAAAAR